ncbi:hypothetical protein PVAP13_7NG362025 [Panicum virgatum]|uniref:Uncharacterized protein n=1 Tax=Panicum virgatum TaxID=38727 RepID=A0A8T0Q8G6_PANVG|nr:hypothetical protein PVAP13_7NG362025 [Panicum virgatum]
MKRTARGSYGCAATTTSWSPRSSNHVARPDEVYASGALTRALVVRRPGAGATRADVRFYMRDLFARLRVGGAEMRREAAAALAEVLRDDEKCVRVVASDVPYDVGVLVKLLECPDAYRGDLVVGGVIAPVVRSLDAGACSATAKERAARVLFRLTKNSDNAWVVAARRGVTELLNVCTDHGGVLRSLAGVDEIRKYMVADAGAVPALVSLS